MPTVTSSSPEGGETRGSKARVAHLMRWVRRLVPVVLIALILDNIDLGELLDIARDVHGGWLFLGLVFMPSRVLAATLRWFVFLRSSFGSQARWGRTLRNYWAGVALGFFTPASAGLEVYRVIVASRGLGAPRMHVAIVSLEKVLALVGCAVTALAAVPLLPPLAVGPSEVVANLAWLAAAALTVGAAIALTARRAIGSRLVATIDRWAEALLARVLPRLPSFSKPSAPGSTKPAIRSLLALRPLGLAFGASVAVQLAGAVGGQIMFRAVGYEIPFAVNVFVVPMLYVLFALPISIGSIGIREGGYIVLYGLFGVPAEVALLVSFLNLLGLGLNSLIGAATIWIGGEGRNNCSAAK